IRSFAENAGLLLARKDPESAAKNLSRISELARRMGRIIKNLRAFARQEREPISDVDIGAVVEAVLELSETRLRAEQVALDWLAPEPAISVRGGEVRLQQVVTNLVSNAIDAMDGVPEKRLQLSLVRRGSKVLLQVRDSGPGLDDPAKIFDPFYTTKAVGQSDGMGLGLSISYGLVQSFGGVIRGLNHPGGGAIFTVELTAGGLEVAA
ncbi:MAG: sensor histidine kinase, partial [Halocynthiibacter sp.]